MDLSDLEHMSGESAYRAPRGLELNEVSINGDAEIVENADGTFSKKGGFFRKRILVGRKNKDEKPEEENLGEKIEVVFLKIRRKLVERGEKGVMVRSTAEHNSKYDVTSLYDVATKQRVTGLATDLRERYSNLRTVQVVYALLLSQAREPVLVRVIIKGSALGSVGKQPGVVTFYDYVGSFPKGEHVWHYRTTLSSVKETGAKTYFTMNFKVGGKLDDDTQGIAIEQLRMVHASCVELDEHLAAKIVATPHAGAVRVEEKVPSEATGIDYPKDEINPDEIPF